MTSEPPSTTSAALTPAHHQTGTGHYLPTRKNQQTIRVWPTLWLYLVVTWLAAGGLRVLQPTTHLPMQVLTITQFAPSIGVLVVLAMHPRSRAADMARTGRRDGAANRGRRRRPGRGVRLVPRRPGCYRTGDSLDQSRIAWRAILAHRGRATGRCLRRGTRLAVLSPAAFAAALLPCGLSAHRGGLVGNLARRVLQ